MVKNTKHHKTASPGSDKNFNPFPPWVPPPGQALPARFPHILLRSPRRQDRHHHRRNLQVQNLGSWQMAWVPDWLSTPDKYLTYIFQIWETRLSKNFRARSYISPSRRKTSLSTSGNENFSLRIWGISQGLEFQLWPSNFWTQLPGVYAPCGQPLQRCRRVFWLSTTQHGWPYLRE